MPSSGAPSPDGLFLTGSPDAVRDVTRRYGVFFAKKEDGSVDHTQLTSLVDAEGKMRVQYLGARFDPEGFQLRIGLNTGAVIAGVLGTRKFALRRWGDTVNTAKRMESYGLPGRVHVSATTRQALGDAFGFEPRGLIDIKGKGSVETYFVYR
jgi:class 3 adenylate cyclase